MNRFYIERIIGCLALLYSVEWAHKLLETETVTVASSYRTSSISITRGADDIPDSLSSPGRPQLVHW